MFSKTTLKNGLRLIAVPSKSTETVTILVLVGTGSKYEDKKTSGASHFLEHLLLKGTQKRPTEMDVFRVIEEIGGINNAFTGSDYTGYWAKVQASKFETVLEWTSDIFLNSTLDPEALEKERGTIIEEINMYYDHPMRHLGTLWSQVLYGDQPAGWDIAGTKETVSQITRDQLLAYRANHYVASNTIICIAGNYGNIDVAALVEKYFSATPVNKTSPKPPVTDGQVSPQVLLHKKDTNQTHVALGVRAFNLFHPQRYALELLGVALGGMVTSRLFEEVRIKRGLAYDVHTEILMDPDTGSLMSAANLDSQRLDEGIKVILAEYKKVAQNGITTAELQKAKDNSIGRTKIILESSNAQASFYGDQELLENRTLTPDEIYAQIQKVTLKDIQNVAKEIFQPKNLNLALIGPHTDPARFERLLDAAL